MVNSIQSTSGTINFRLKDPKTLKETSIIADYSFGRGNRIRYSTGFKVYPKHWDLGKQRIRSISTINNREDVNSKLKEIESEFIKRVNNLDEDSKKSDKKVLRRIFDQVSGRLMEKTDLKLDFFKFADAFIESKEEQISKVKSVKLSVITIRAYKQTINRLKEFDKKNNYHLDFDNIDLNFYYLFINFLEEEKYSLNTIGKHIKNLKTILNRATETGLNTNLKYQQREFKVLTEITTEIYLSTEEIDKIYNLDLSDKPHWGQARDLFIIGYYTGQRVSDFNRLTNDNIKVFEGNRVFEIHQMKTKKTIYVPIHKKILNLLEARYNGNLPSKMPDKSINEYIKLVGEKAKIDELIIHQITRAGKIEKESIPKYNMIGTHTARRSFCTNAYLSKMPVIDIMAISGHTTEKEFYKYIRVTKQERAIKIGNSAFFRN